jgi:small conductance mechanosensitive channel
MFELDVALRSIRQLGTALIAWTPRLGASLVVVLLFFVVARATQWAARRAVHSHTRHRNLQIAIGRLAFTAAISIGVLVAATIAFPTFTIGSLIQLLGVSGVVIGFAFKDIFQNFLGGILLLITNPFQVGDQIVVDSFEGTVEEIQPRATLITTYDRRRVIVPNSDLFTKSVTVNTAFERRRVVCDVKVKGGDDARRIQQLLERTVRGGIEGVEKDPIATVLLVALAGDALTFRLLWWSSPVHGDSLIVQDRVLLAVHEALAQEQLSVA